MQNLRPQADCVVGLHLDPEDLHVAKSGTTAVSPKVPETALGPVLKVVSVLKVAFSLRSVFICRWFQVSIFHLPSEQSGQQTLAVGWHGVGPGAFGIDPRTHMLVRVEAG